MWKIIAIVVVIVVVVVIIGCFACGPLGSSKKEPKKTGEAEKKEEKTGTFLETYNEDEVEYFSRNDNIQDEDYDKFAYTSDAAFREPEIKIMGAKRTIKRFSM